MIWKTKDGRELEIKDMSSQHIKSALEMLIKKGFVSYADQLFYMTCKPPQGNLPKMLLKGKLQKF